MNKKVPEIIQKKNKKLSKALTAVIGGTIGLVGGAVACFAAMGIFAISGMVLILSSLVLAVAALPVLILAITYRMGTGDVKPLTKLFSSKKEAVDKAKQLEKDKATLKELDKLSTLLQKGLDTVEDKKKKLEKKVKEEDKKLQESTIIIDRVKII